MTRHRWRRTGVQLGAVAVLAAAAVVALVHPGTAGDTAAVNGPAVPSRGAYLGVSVAPQPPRRWTQGSRLAALHAFESAVSAKLAIAHAFAASPTQVATASNVRSIAEGRILLLSWALPDTRRIASGEADATIRTTARQVAALRAPIFLEPRWEMDRPNLAGSVHSPEDFIAAWRHVRTIFAAEHVDDVGWVWCPTAAGFARGRAQTYYPGDGEVDWICSDVYPLSSYVPGTYEPFRTLVVPFMSWAAGRDRPIMIGEFGVPESYAGRRAGWLRQAFRYVRSTPQIKAVVYYDGPRAAKHPWANYVVDTDRSALQVFSRFASDPYFEAVRR